jgi:hypothetical protein
LRFALAPLFEHYGVQLWTPEAGGRVDFQADQHEQLMLAPGWQSKREITRTRIRVRTAMAAQTREQGRYLGGRPPYGYRLADAGPHPNKAHAAWGRRAHRLEPDPLTAPVVRWMFAQRLAGHSVARITRALNDTTTPCPSASDPKRNPHRTGAAWTLTTVAAILANPRYTGRQVWNHQPTDRDLIDPANTASATARCSDGTCPMDGSSPPGPPTPRWSANAITSPRRTSAHHGVPPGQPRADTAELIDHLRAGLTLTSSVRSSASRTRACRSVSFIAWCSRALVDGPAAEPDGGFGVAVVEEQRRAGVHRGDVSHLVGGQLEVEDVHVLDHPVFAD